MTLALPPNWALPVAIEAYKQRQHIVSGVRAILNIVAAKRRRVIVTGMSGAGKTMLMSALSRGTERRGLRPPEKSLDVERSELHTSEPRRRIGLAVVPGQPGHSKYVAQDNLLLSKYPIDGLIHVVCNGFAAPHEASTGANSLEAFRTSSLKEEEDDLSETLNLLCRAWKRHHKPFWMIVAVTKVDLFQDDLSSAVRRYAPDGQGTFRELMREFQWKIGTLNFRWDTAPVCGLLQEFQHGICKVNPQIDMMARDHYLATFASLLERYCV